jgi:replicative DNA helicase
MSDLKESGGIEEVADVVAMIHRDDYYQRNNPGHIPTNTAEIIIAKQRNGGPGIVKIGFDTRTGKFVNQF